MDETIKQRRAKLRETLEWLRDTPELPNGDKFDIRNWGRVEACGSVHCIAGWYVKRNPDLGLSFVQKPTQSPAGSICWIRETGDKAWNWDSDETDLFAEHFGITTKLAEVLFYPAGDREPDDRVSYARRALEMLDQYELLYECPDDKELSYDEAERLLANSELTLSESNGRVCVSFASKIPIHTFGKLRELMNVLDIYPEFMTNDE